MNAESQIIHCSLIPNSACWWARAGLLVKEGELALLAAEYCNWWACWGGTVVWGSCGNVGGMAEVVELAIVLGSSRRGHQLHPGATAWRCTAAFVELALH